MIEPLTPPGCDLRDWPAMMLDVVRLRDSDLTLISSGDEFKAAVLLWAAAWHQTPAGSLPNDERLLAGLAKVDAKRWPKVRTEPLRGWALASDGRLYHRAVAEKALECWAQKIGHRISSMAGNAKRYKLEFDPSDLEGEREAALVMLERIAPKARALQRTPRRSNSPPDRTPAGSPTGSQEKRREGNDPPEGALSAPADPNREAWDRAKALLVDRGQMSATAAGGFFRNLLKQHRGLEARDLLPSIVSAEGTGTADPQSYLTAAARGVAKRRGVDDAPAAPNPHAWTEEHWQQALKLFNETGRWEPTAGPRPDEPGCRVPAHLLLTPVPTAEAA